MENKIKLFEDRRIRYAWGAERVDEIADPEKAILRGAEYCRAKDKLQLDIKSE